MSDKTKKIFLGLAIMVPFLLYCVYYYSMILRNAPYKFTEFRSFVFQYGTGDSLVNKYNSATGEYQFLNKHDSLIKMHLYLNKSEELDLHHQAAYLGFWNFPADERNTDTTNLHGAKPPRFLIEFNYKRKSKRVIFDENYVGPQKLVDANKEMIKQIQKVMAEAESRKQK
jgi:hypothetical protein